ncbi:hypothetical protein F8388_001233 [Cannabis sativa]|uniref:Uncharacterized protein n=1 Tax=Cannabis sativa TaxID=3483 RepID=A0A7J6GGV1_CANSA|nr:hypothetical protein F8388_001233 [Cannabis sativa]
MTITSSLPQRTSMSTTSICMVAPLSTSLLAKATLTSSSSCSAAEPILTLEIDGGAPCVCFP